MPIRNHQELLKSLLGATKPSEVRAILQDIGDRAAIRVSQPFGDNQYRWEFFGGNDSNMSTVNLGSKSGRSLTERITNAIDAVLEKKMRLTAGDEPSSPIEAAKRWFGRPPTTADNGLFKWKEYGVNDYDRLVRVVLTPGDTDSAPTVDVLDDGIGIIPAEFSRTILSLQKGNKITKHYLAGVFGQGGSATIGFSDYVLIVSRHIHSPNTVGFTLIKLVWPGEPYKEEAYVYLTVQDEQGQSIVPSCELEGPLDVYPNIPTNGRPKPLETGTLVRHLGYRLDGLEKTLNPSPGNLYHLLHYMMFDPLLPFRVIDVRKEGSYKDELVSGSRNRLMKYTLEELESSEESRTQLRHHAPREMISPRSDENPSIGVEYWVVLGRQKRGDKMELRSYSNDLFLDRNHPVVGTMNGQNQGEMTARILRDLELPMVAKHIVIHLDATQASSETRRKLFTSTREGFKEGDVLNEITRVVTNMLKEDATLFEIERELSESIVKKEMSETSNEVKKQITKLLRSAGLAVTTPGEVLIPSASGGASAEAPPKTGSRPQVRKDPLPTLPYPEVTRFEIVYPEEIMEVHKQDNHSLRIETDADFRFDREKRIAVRVEPPNLEVASKSMLDGGRMHWRLRPTEDSVPSDTGKIIATLTKPDGSQLVATIDYKVLPAREEKLKKEKGLVPDFDIRPLDPDTEREDFDKVWGNVEQVESVAYKAMRTAGKLTIYYSTAFPPFREQRDKLKLQPSFAMLFEQNYAIWIGYHAIIQDQQRPRAMTLFEVEDEQLDKVLEHERAVVAEMQVKQAVRISEIQSQSLKQTATE